MSDLKVDLILLFVFILAQAPVHELGHYIMAKKNNIKVVKFNLTSIEVSLDRPILINNYIIILLSGLIASWLFGVPLYFLLHEKMFLLAYLFGTLAGCTNDFSMIIIAFKNQENGMWPKMSELRKESNI